MNWRVSSITAMLMLAGATLPLHPQATAAPDLFPYNQGWLGGDAAYSIPIDSTRTLWLFGDTFVGKTRNERGMIHNSVAIRMCKPECGVTYWWSRNARGEPASYFKTPEADYFWPLDGFVADGKLYVFLEQMRSTSGGGAFGFDYQSVKLAIVSNPTADPSHWRITYRVLSEGNRVVPGIATSQVQENGIDYLFVFTLFRQSADHPFIGLLRHPLNNLFSDALNQHWQYLSTGSQLRGSQWREWSPSTSPVNASRLLSGNVTEMSVKYHSKEKFWLAVYPAPGGLFTNAVYSRASQLAGPWTTPRPLFSYPEMESGDPRHTPHVFCYAAKEHPELESNHKLALTYACNSSQEPEIFRDLRLYKPNSLFVALPDAAPADRNPPR